MTKRCTLLEWRDFFGQLVVYLGIGNGIVTNRTSFFHAAAAAAIAFVPLLIQPCHHSYLVHNMSTG